jgi:hypothetical protein
MGMSEIHASRVIFANRELTEGNEENEGILQSGDVRGAEFIPRGSSLQQLAEWIPRSERIRAILCLLRCLLCRFYSLSAVASAGSPSSNSRPIAPGSSPACCLAMST